MARHRGRVEAAPCSGSPQEAGRGTDVRWAHPSGDPVKGLTTNDALWLNAAEEHCEPWYTAAYFLPEVCHVTNTRRPCIC
jgi:hypothetical protein